MFAVTAEGKASVAGALAVTTTGCILARARVPRDTDMSVEMLLNTGVKEVALRLNHVYIIGYVCA